MQSIYSTTIAIVLLMSVLVKAFYMVPFSSARGINRRLMSDKSDFDAESFDKALRSAAPTWGKDGVFSKSDKETLDKIREEQESRSEEIYRVYPFENKALPVLPDCNNYYSGKFEEYFWHQNADQVYVYIPIEDDVSKNDISATFEAKRVSVSVKGVQVVEFECLERIIPDGSFWIIETDKEDKKKFIQLDLEKRFRMINWKSLFGEAPKEVEADLESRRTQMLEKLFSANKGISKLTGAEPETIDEMMQIPELDSMISSDVDTNPRVVDEDGNVLESDVPGDLDDLQESVREVLGQMQRDIEKKNSYADAIDVEDESVGK